MVDDNEASKYGDMICLSDDWWVWGLIILPFIQGWSEIHQESRSSTGSFWRDDSSGLIEDPNDQERRSIGI